MQQPNRLIGHARAKVNLCLHITDRRPDGFHLLDSLVVFPEIADEISVQSDTKLTLSIDGPFAKGLSSNDNLILDAARILSREKGAAIKLTKNLPLASGIGGGSSNAATVLNLLAELWNEPLPARSELTTLGADVPVCMSQKSQHMRGIGDVLAPIKTLPSFALVLANAGRPVATGQVFKNLISTRNEPVTTPFLVGSIEDFVGYLSGQRNDMQDAAIKLCPEISGVIKVLSMTARCRLARMSGSGGTCFGVFDDMSAANVAVQSIRDRHPSWWVQSGIV